MQTAAKEVPGYTDVLAVAEQLGIHPRTLKKRLARLSVPLYKNPLDERMRMVRSEDVERLLQPRALATADLSE